MHSLATKLSTYHIILGSASPRRRELLAGLDIDFEIRVKDTKEIIDNSLSAEYVPQSIAKQKFEAFIPDLQENDFLITADTIVICDNKILGKPKSIENAKEILQFLSNKTHTVVTGVHFGTRDKQQSFSCKTQVTFAKLSTSDIDYYVEKYKPMDKAGSYGVQEWIGYIGIEKIEGSYYNVMGLPVQKLFTEITKFFISHETR